VLCVDTGQVPFNIMGPSSSSSSAAVSGVSNCLTVEQLQLMSHLAQQHQQRPVYAPALEAALGHGQHQLLAGYMQQPPTPPHLSAVNNTAVRLPQPQLRGTAWLVQWILLIVTIINEFCFKVHTERTK